MIAIIFWSLVAIFLFKKAVQVFNRAYKYQTRYPSYHYTIHMEWL